MLRFGEDVYISSALVKEPEQAMVSMAVRRGPLPKSDLEIYLALAASLIVHGRISGENNVAENERLGAGGIRKYL